MGRDMGPILSKIEQLEESNRRLSDFAKILIRSAWEGGSWDGGEIQSLALQNELLRETTYDPKIHGDGYFVKEGAEWYVFSEFLKDTESNETTQAEE